MKLKHSENMAKMFPTLALATALVGNAYADCRPSVPKNGNPEGFSKSVTVKLDTSRFEAAEASSVQIREPLEIRQSGIISLRNKVGWIMNFEDGWQCNFSSFRRFDGSKRMLTAKHCVSNEFLGINSDAWVSANFNAASVRVRIMNDVQDILESASELPSNGEKVTVAWCTGLRNTCFQLEGVLEWIFKENGEPVRGIWISKETYSKMTGGRTDSNLEGLSWAPAMNAEWKVFWSVSATIATDFQANESGQCVAQNYAIAIAPMEK